MHTANYIYQHDEQSLTGFLAYGEQIATPRPAVLVVHDWSGRNELACQKALMLAQLGYVGFAVDMYGEGRIGETNDEKKALMQPLLNDRHFLQARIRAAFDALCTLDYVDKQRIAVIGFCFGGLCALDLARSGADLVGAVSFHGLLNAPAKPANKPIKAKLLVLHGYDDPMIKPVDVNDFCREMTDAGVDWQVIMYGHTQHGFTNPQAHDKQLGTMFNSQTAQRSFQAMRNFLAEILI